VARPGQAWILDRPVLPPVCARTSHRWPSVRMYTSRRPRELRFPFHQCRSVLTRRTYSAGRREEILTARDRAWPSSPRHPPNTHHHTAAVRRSPGRLSSVGGRGRRRVVVGHVLQPGVALAAQRPPRPAHRHLRPRQQFGGRAVAERSTRCEMARKTSCGTSPSTGSMARDPNKSYRVRRQSYSVPVAAGG